MPTKMFHKQPVDSRQNLIDDLNTWMQEVTGDQTIRFPLEPRATHKELELIMYAINTHMDKCHAEHRSVQKA